MGRKRDRLEQSGRWPAAVALSEPSASADPVEALIARARKLRDKGDARKALLLLRQACMMDEWCARSWTLLGVVLARAGRVDEGLKALRHARWLRSRAGDQARTVSTARLIERLTLAA